MGVSPGTDHIPLSDGEGTLAHRDEDTSHDKCIYPLHPSVEQEEEHHDSSTCPPSDDHEFLSVIEEKHISQSTDFDLEALLGVLNNIFLRCSTILEVNCRQESGSHVSADAHDQKSENRLSATALHHKSERIVSSDKIHQTSKEHLSSTALHHDSKTHLSVNAHHEHSGNQLSSNELHHQSENHLSGSALHFESGNSFSGSTVSHEEYISGIISHLTTSSYRREHIESLSKQNEENIHVNHKQESKVEDTDIDEEDTESSGFCLTSEEEEILKLTVDKDSSESTTFNSKPLMEYVQSIFKYSFFESVSKQHSKETESHLSTEILDLPDNIQEIIQHLSWLISCKHNCQGEGQDLTFIVLEVLFNFTWEAKVSLILAAFAKNYGKFSHRVVQRTNETQLSQLLSMVKRRPVAQTSEAIVSHFTQVSQLTQSVMNLASLSMEFIKFAAERKIIEKKVTKALHMAICRIIKSVNFCLSYMESVKKHTGYTSSRTEIEQKEYFCKELHEAHTSINEFMGTIGSKEVETIFQSEHQDVHEVVSKLFSEEYVLNGGQVSLKELEGHTVAFLVTESNISKEKLTTLTSTYEEINQKKGFKVVWIPVVDSSVQWTEKEEQYFSELASSMSWNWCHPSVVSKGFSKYISKEWHHEESTLVVLDQQGKVISKNAMQMVNTWGASAFPFSEDMEVSICKSWTLERMLEDMHIHQPELENKIICLYGGDDIEMINRFFEAVGKINRTNGDLVDAVYVGTTEKQENLPSIVSTLEEKKARCLSEADMSSCWKRLRLILDTRMEHCEEDDEVIVTDYLDTLIGYSSEALYITMMHRGCTDFMKFSQKKLWRTFTGLSETDHLFQQANKLLHQYVDGLEGKNLDYHYVSIALQLIQRSGEKIRCPLCNKPMKKSITGAKQIILTCGKA